MLCIVCGLKELSGKQREYCSKPCEKKGWRLKNREKMLISRKRYREKHKEKIALYDKKYKESHPQIKEKNATILKKYFSCLRCKSKTNLEVHHIKSQRFGGGADDFNNLVVLCKSCHALWHKFFNLNYWLSL